MCTPGANVSPCATPLPVLPWRTDHLICRDCTGLEELVNRGRGVNLRMMGHSSLKGICTPGEILNTFQGLLLGNGGA